jgi:hypothetical protein
MKRHQKDMDTPKGTSKSLDRSETGKKYPVTKADVENSNDEKIDEDFKGFPHPPAQEHVIRKKETN